jgi:hypothetical protein
MLPMSTNSLVAVDSSIILSSDRGRPVKVPAKSLVSTLCVVFNERCDCEASYKSSSSIRLANFEKEMLVVRSGSHCSISVALTLFSSASNS